MPPEAEILARAILSITHLESLTIKVPGSRSPFLDHIVQQLPHLREPYCVQGCYSSHYCGKSGSNARSTIGGLL